MAKNKLSIYLLKSDVCDKEDIFEASDKVQELKVYADGSVAYFLPSYVREPSWMRGFFKESSDEKLKQANSRVVLIKRITIAEEIRTFALTFGYARFMFKDGVLEEQFGLKIVLNSIEQNQIRKISKTSIGTNQKQSEEQLPKSSDISEFGFDINRDLMKNVSGKSEEEMFEKSMLTGGDIFSLTVSRDIENIEEFLFFCYQEYKKTTYQEKFAWIDNIKYVKDKQMILQLNEKLIKTIKDKNYAQVWLAVPEVVSWEDIKDFRISGIEETFNDLYIEKLIESLKGDLIDIAKIQNKRIYARASRDELENAYEWSAYRCLVAEISVDGQEYCLNNAKWYKINNDFAAQINKQYSTLELCDTSFVDYANEDEDKYNSKLKDELENSKLLHKYKIAIGGGQGNNIEPCDILWNNKMIHVKRNGGSSMLSHLFNQALVSCQMWMDPKFREQLRQKMQDDGLENEIKEPFHSNEYEIIIAIINKFAEARPKIPFFSKVSICFTASNIQNLGYKVKLKNIKIKE